MSDNINRLLIVDGKQDDVTLVESVASGMGFATASAAHASEFLTLVDSFDPTVVLLDLQLPEGDGVEILRLLVARDCKADVILMSSTDSRVLSATYDLGVSRGLPMAGSFAKPMDAKVLQTKLSTVFKQDRALTVSDLMRALDEKQLVAYFQPKASLMKGGGWRIDAVEALVRWQHPSLGIVMPDEFIPMAERTGLIGRLTDQILDQSLAQVREWTDMGLQLKCAVNVPPGLVTDLSFPDRVAALLARYGVPSKQLALELTETATMQDPTRTMDVLTRLRVKQIGLSLDDFGTGYSSLTRLYQMPFDELKIDKSLVMSVPRSREANTMVGSLIELGHNLGLKICAEGVESRAALDLLEILNCDRCQGFYLSRALPANRIASFVTRWNVDSPASSVAKLAQAIV